MKISEHANYLLNEYGRLQFDYAAYCKPYGESLRNEARNNLETYIAELEAYIDQLIEIGGWAITGMTIATYYSPGVLQDLAEKKSDDWYALIKNLKECDKEKEREE